MPALDLKTEIGDLLVSTVERKPGRDPLFMMVDDLNGWGGWRFETMIFGPDGLGTVRAQHDTREEATRAHELIADAIRNGRSLDTTGIEFGSANPYREEQ